MKKVKKMAIGGMSGPRPSPNPGKPGPVNPNPPMVKPGGQPMMPPQGQLRPPPALAPNPGKPGPVNPGMGPKPMMGAQPSQGQLRPPPALAPNPGKPGPANSINPAMGALKSAMSNPQMMQNVGNTIGGMGSQIGAGLANSLGNFSGNTVKPSGPSAPVVPLKKGGKVSSASARADGIAQRGKTKGKFV